MVEGIIGRIVKGVIVAVGTHVISKEITKRIDRPIDPEKQVKIINDFNNFKTKLKNKKWSKPKKA